MTREDVDKQWEFIVAFKEGKQIQWQDDETNVWHNANTPSFDIRHTYRIKPEPKTCYILWVKVFSVWQSYHIHANRAFLEKIQRTHYSGEYTKITEVLEPLDD